MPWYRHSTSTNVQVDWHKIRQFSRIHFIDHCFYIKMFSPQRRYEDFCSYEPDRVRFEMAGPLRMATWPDAVPNGTSLFGSRCYHKQAKAPVSQDGVQQTLWSSPIVCLPLPRWPFQSFIFNLHHCHRRRPLSGAGLPSFHPGRSYRHTHSLRCLLLSVPLSFFLSSSSSARHLCMHVHWFSMERIISS